MSMTGPGRELDAEVAEKIMNLTPFWDEDQNDFGVEEHFVGERRLNYYSTTIEGAWQVVDELTLNKYSFCCGIDDYSEVWVTIRHSSEDRKSSPKDGAIVYAPREYGIPYAFCLAALETKVAKT